MISQPPAPGNKCTVMVYQVHQLWMFPFHLLRKRTSTLGTISHGRGARVLRKTKRKTKKPRTRRGQ